METRPGIKTTEFFVTVFIQIVAVLELIADPFNIPNKWVILAQAISASVYALSRGIAKQGVPAARVVDPAPDATYPG